MELRASHILGSKHFDIELYPQPSQGTSNIYPTYNAQIKTETIVHTFNQSVNTNSIIQVNFSAPDLYTHGVK